MAVHSAQWYIEHNMNANSAVGNYSNDCTNDRVVEDAQVKRDINNGRNFGSALNRGGNNNRGPLTPVQQLQEAGRGKSNISDAIETNNVDYEGMTSRTGATTVFQTEILKQLKIESDLHTEINERMGITGDLSRAYRDTLLESAGAAAQMGFDIGNISDMVTTLGEKSGRFNLFSKETLDRSFSTSRAFGMSLTQLADSMSKFEEVGYGSADTLEKIETAGRHSLGLGLNSKKTTEELRTNISKLNEYGFANGIEGLNRMVQKSVEFRMNMAETFKVADKVMNPESAIELTANMQMLGGAIGDLNDPLKLMYMATNNVEGLQDAIIGASSGLATYNKEQGKFEIVGANLRRAKEMATQLGISYGEFAKSAVASQERIAANNTLLSKGFDMSPKDREFLTNMSQMKDGKMQITIPESLSDKFNKQTEVTLDSLTQEQIEVLKENRKAFEKLSVEELARQQFTTSKQIFLETQSAAISLRLLAKNRTLGKNEDVSANNGANFESAQRGRLPYLRDLANRQITDNTVPIGGKLDIAMTAAGRLVQSLITTLKGVNTELKTVFGDVVETQKMKEREEKKRIQNEKSNPTTNQFVIKSDISVSYRGFGMPTAEIKGGFLSQVGTK